MIFHVTVNKKNCKILEKNVQLTTIGYYVKYYYGLLKHVNIT